MNNCFINGHICSDKEHVQLKFGEKKIARILRVVVQTGANLAVL